MRVTYCGKGTVRVSLKLKAERWNDGGGVWQSVHGKTKQVKSLKPKGKSKKHKTQSATHKVKIKG